MSKISTVYPSIISSIVTLFPLKSRMHNPYQIIENPEIVRKNAWGLKVEEATREEIEFCNLSLVRQYTIVFVRQFVSLSNKEDGYDAVTISIMEDQQSVSSLLISQDELGVEGDIDRIDIVSISGISELVDTEKKYLTAEVTFNITLSELI